MPRCLIASLMTESTLIVNRHPTESCDGDCERSPRFFDRNGHIRRSVYTICDPYLFTLAQWWEADGVNSTRLPKLQDHGHRMRQRPAVVRALAAENA